MPLDDTMETDRRPFAPERNKAFLNAHERNIEDYESAITSHQSALQGYRQELARMNEQINDEASKMQSEQS
ncbi:MAG TPA: hypothetical protein VIL42_01560 [Sphingomicrobium sp.]|jgi:hypothetical protein